MAISFTFTGVCTYRALLGAAESLNAPACYSLIVDYFPPERRTLGNATFSIGIPIGSSLSSLSALFVGLMGWRGVYLLVGSYGGLVGLIILVILHEPMRSRFDVKVTKKP